MILGFKFDAKLTLAQEDRATEINDVCRFVWNLALEQRREYRRRGVWIGFYEQSAQLTDLRTAENWIAGVPRAAVEATLRELDRACRRHGTWRVRWKSKRDVSRSFLCRSRNYIRVERVNRRWGRVRVEGLGWIKFRMTRDIAGELRNVRVVNRQGRWTVSITMEDGLVEAKPSGPAVGVDRGVAQMVATSDGWFVNREFVTPKETERRKRLQQQLARQSKTSNRRKATRAKLQRINRRIADRRKDFNARTAHRLTTDYGLIVVEDLNVAGMTKRGRGKRGLNRVILDKGWSQFLTNLDYMAKRYGAEVVRVNPAYTSQTCADCGHIASENRESQAAFRCVSCGHTAHADTNAALNILAAGYAVTGRGDFAEVGRSAKRQPSERNPRSERISKEEA